MKKKLLLIITLLFTSIVSAQYTEIVEMAEERNKPEEYYEYYDNGNIAFKSFKDKDGNLNGMTIIYYENGNIKVKGNLVKDSFDGDVYIYNEEGVLTELKNYTLGDIKTSKQYYQNGQLESEEYYMYGIKLRVKGYYSNGNLFYEQQSTNHPTNTIYYENGEKKAQGSFKMDGKGEFITDENEKLIKIGEWKYYDENGNLTLKETYKFGKLVSSEKVEEKSDDFKKKMNSPEMIGKLQSQYTKAIKDLSVYFGSDDVDPYSFNCYMDPYSKFIFFKTKYKKDKVYYNGKYYYDVMYEIKLKFTDVISVEKRSNSIYFNLNSNGFITRAKPQGDSWSEFVQNKKDFYITIKNTEKKEEAYEAFQYLVEHPYGKD